MIETLLARRDLYAELFQRPMQVRSMGKNCVLVPARYQSLLISVHEAITRHAVRLSGPQRGFQYLGIADIQRNGICPLAKLECVALKLGAESDSRPKEQKTTDLLSSYLRIAWFARRRRQLYLLY